MLHVAYKFGSGNDSAYTFNLDELNPKSYMDAYLPAIMLINTPWYLDLSLSKYLYCWTEGSSGYCDILGIVYKAWYTNKVL